MNHKHFPTLLGTVCLAVGLFAASPTVLLAR